MTLISSIPSPSSKGIEIGPLNLRAYGLMIALGVLAAGWLFGRRLERRSVGTREDASSITTWAVIAGVLGARAYHIITNWNSDFVNPLNWLKIWQGGLGIPGGLIAGVLVGVWRIKARGLDVPRAIDAAIPAIPLAQAIGRWGNWFNQEIFGRPTTLPWALRIDDRIAESAGYAPGTTFHPTFLYESLGNLVLCAALIVFGRRIEHRPGRLIGWWLAGYGALRFAVESLRVDEANKIAGIRINTWTSGITFVAAVGWLIVTRRRDPATPPATAPPAPLESPD